MIDREWLIRRLFRLATKLGRPYKREAIEAMLWSALNDDGRGYTGADGYETAARR